MKSKLKIKSRMPLHEMAEPHFRTDTYDTFNKSVRRGSANNNLNRNAICLTHRPSIPEHH